MTGRYRISLAYDGTAYAGWQVQPGQATIQGELERVLEQLVGQPVRVHCSGRTDAGVHAHEQVAHFDLAEPADIRRLQHGMNALLEADIRILRAARCSPEFHARFSAVGKEYRYHFWTGAVMPPPLRLYRTHEPGRLDIAAMREAASYLVGHHDFAAFSANPNREVDGTVRRLETLDVRSRGSEVTVIAAGEGFLYKMVRSLAGFLLRVGRGEVAPEHAREILASKVRTARVPTAPPQGLFLWKVFYK
jgi:tRNA pseudouridine38-40 synthase